MMPTVYSPLSAQEASARGATAIIANANTSAIIFFMIVSSIHTDKFIITPKGDYKQKGTRF